MNEADGFRDLVRHNMFDKGQSKRIWGELYKVLDSSDVVVQVVHSFPPFQEKSTIFWLAEAVVVHSVPEDDMLVHFL